MRTAAARDGEVERRAGDERLLELALST